MIKANHDDLFPPISILNPKILTKNKAKTISIHLSWNFRTKNIFQNVCVIFYFWYFVTEFHQLWKFLKYFITGFLRDDA